MQLVRRDQGRFEVSRDRLAEVRDVGARLEYMITRYERLVRDLVRDLAPSPELQSRLRLLNREIGILALSLQDLMLARRETTSEYVSIENEERAGVVASA